MAVACTSLVPDLALPVCRGLQLQELKLFDWHPPRQNFCGKLGLRHLVSAKPDKRPVVGLWALQ